MPVFFFLKTESGDFHRRFAFVFYPLIVATVIRRAIEQRTRVIPTKAYASKAVAIIAVFRRRSVAVAASAAATVAVVAIHADIAAAITTNALIATIPPAVAVVTTIATVTGITAAPRTITIERRITRIIPSFA